jgi:hypothetical protein
MLKWDDPDQTGSDHGLSIDDVVITWTVSISAPSTQAYNLTFPTIGQNSMTASWTNGNGGKRIVIMNTSNSFTDPSNGSDPTAITNYSGSGEQVVFNGTGNSVHVTGLSTGSTYWYRVYEYNGTGSATMYLTSTGTNNPLSEKTLTGGTPTITVTAILTDFSTTLGTASTPQTYTVSGLDLTDNLSISAPTGFQIREEGSPSYASSLSFIPEVGVVAVKSIEVIYNPTSGVVHSGNILHSSTGATDVNTAVSGTASATYYYSGSGSITDPTKWGINTNGTGYPPVNFNSNAQVFNLTNSSAYTLDAVLAISGTGSKLVVGDGTNACNFTIPSGFAYTGTVDVTALSTLTLQNATIPTLGTLNTASTVSYEYSGSSNVQANTYGNLTLKNGTKVLPNLTSTVISGNLTFDNVTLDAGSANPFTTLTLSGDLTYLGAVTNPADANSFTLVCNKVGTQTITGNGNTVRLFRLTTSGSNTNVVLSTSGGSTNLLLANLTSGGLSLGTGTNLTINSNTVEFLTNGAGYFLGTGTGTLTCDGTSNLILNTTRSSTLGTIYFASGSNSLNNFTLNETGTSSFAFGSSFNVLGTLTMTSGDINMGANTLTLGSSISTLGTLDRTTGTIIGKFARWFAASTSVFRLFPVGTATLYRPVDLSFTGAPSTGGTLTVEHIASNPGVINISSLDDNGYILDAYSQVGYWRISVGDGLSNDGVYSVNLTMAGIVGVADFTKLHVVKRSLNTSPWVVNGIHADGTGSNSTPVCSRTGISGFSEFGIASNSADNMLDGVLPVTLSSLNSSVIGRNIKINWTTASEQNNAGFNVERTIATGNTWEKIGFVNGHGTINTPTNYSFEDKNLQTGKYKYRLKQIDVNGNFEYFALNGEVEIGVPKKFDMSQNYPNPFNPVTKINFDLPENGLVNLRLYDMLGREVATLVNEVRTAGYYTVNFDASTLSSGIYFYRMNAGKFSSIKKMAIIK